MTHSVSSLARGGTLVTTGGTAGFDVRLDLIRLITDQLTISGSIMGMLDDMKNLMNLIVREGIRTMWEGKTQGKTVFTR